MSFHCPMKAAGFSTQQIRDALEFCDNDRERSLSWLKKQQKSGGKLQWNEALKQLLVAMPAGQLKEQFTKMLSYNNVPIKPKTFKNFARNSFALQRNEALVEQMWTTFEPLVRKTPAPTPAPRAPAPAPAPAPSSSSSDSSDSSDSEHDDAAKSQQKRPRQPEGGAMGLPGGKDAKRARKQAQGVLAALDGEQLKALAAGLGAGVDLAKEVQQALSSRVPATTAAAPASGQPKAEKSRKKKKKKNKEQEDKKAKKKSKKKSKKQPA